MATLHPENLEEGKKYKFTYISSRDKKCSMTGIYKGIHIESKLLWLVFEIHHADGSTHDEHWAMGDEVISCAEVE